MKILRAYIITVTVCLSIITTATAILVADENAKKITVNEDSAVLVLSSSDEKLYPEAVNPMPIIEKIMSGAKKAAGFAPPPINNLYWFFSNLRKTEN